MKRAIFLIGFVAAAQSGVAQTNASWKFAVSGDSRNCGDIVMPAIAQSVRANGAQFYWHLGDFRAIFKADEDLSPPALPGVPPRPMGVSDYLATAWPDFIARQLGPFGDLPVFLAPGNHEFIPPMTRADYIAQFGDWLNTPVIREQRLKDNPADHKLKTYYHWIKNGVDFISIDNTTVEQLEPAQLYWVLAAISRDERTDQVKTIVMGMHEALPGSLSDDHSMSESGQGERTGRQVYEALWHAQSVAKKHVYVLASHSHFYMDDVYNTAAWKDKVLPGWIVGTAGAQRYVLPRDVKAGAHAMTNVYGYLLVTVSAGGTISAAFQKLSLEDLTKASPRTPEALVKWCYEQNHQ